MYISLESCLLDLGLIIFDFENLFFTYSIISLSNSPLKYLLKTFPPLDKVSFAKFNTSSVIELVLKSLSFYYLLYLLQYLK